MRICITTFGSFGDLHPALGLAGELRARGHATIVATSPIYRQAVEADGHAFEPVRPDLDPNDRALIARLMDPMRGTERLLDELMPHLAASHADLRRAAASADLLISHPITFAAPIVAEHRGIPWVSTVLSPMSFFSRYDFPVLPPMPGLARLTNRSRRLAGVVYALSRVATRRWAVPVQRLRRELGLPRRGNPIFEGQHSPSLVLAMFSRVLADPQPDWPPAATITGAVRYDRSPHGATLPSALEEFLARGAPPVVFTLGSAAVGAAGTFYEESARAVAALGCRAVLVVGSYPENRPRTPLPPDVIVTEYAPYSALFPRAAAIVHQGGIGTTHRALAAGVPMLVVPFAHDQPDNAARVERLGVARTLRLRAYRGAPVARLLGMLLDDAAVQGRASEIGAIVRQEEGAQAAADAIERLVDAGAPVRKP